MSVPVISVEPAKEHSAEPESRLSEEERKVLAEIRIAKYKALEKIKELQRQIADIDSELEFMTEVTTEELKQEQLVEQRKRAANKKFNEKPSEGIRMLVAEGFLKETPEDVAAYLKEEKMLSKLKIGEYLGDHKEFNVATLQAFVTLHNFREKTLVDALREFLGSFHLPGEAQKIDRIMELFAKHYCECVPGNFTSSDTCYVLAFSVIMLNTSLHNPSVKDRPDVERFIVMNRGINEGQDLPREVLVELYESIKKEAFKVPDSEKLAETFFNPEREGWLTKEGGKVKSRRKRWFILKDSVLYYFKKETALDEELVGSIPLDNLKVRPMPERNAVCFEIYSEGGMIKAWKKDSDNKVVKGNHDRYHLEAQNEEERDIWIKCIGKSIGDAVYNGFKLKKRKLAQEGPRVY